MKENEELNTELTEVRAMVKEFQINARKYSRSQMTDSNSQADEKKIITTSL